MHGKIKIKDIVDIRQLKKKQRKLRILYAVLGVMVMATMIRSFLRQEYTNVFTCVLTYLLFLLPTFIEQHLHLHFPNVLESIALIFIFSAEILGEINCYYQKVPHWDTVLHTINGFIFAAVGFALLDIINRNPNTKFSLSPLYLSVVAFCFSMTIGILWEFGEFGCDRLFGTDAQKDTYVSSIHTVLLDTEQTNTPVDIENIQSVTIEYEDENGKEKTVITGGYIDIGIIDTMKDLFVNFIGAVVFSIIGYFYIKQRGKGKIASDFIPVIDDEQLPATQEPKIE